MYITQAQLNKRLNGFEELDRVEPKKKVDLNINEKAFLGSLVGEDTASNIGKVFGVSTDVVSKASKGINTVKEGINSELKTKVDEIREDKKGTARDKALDNLIQSLGVVNLTAPNIKKASEAASVARSMAEIVDKLDGGSSDKGTKVNILIHAPSRHDEKSYDVIEVG